MDRKAQVQAAVRRWREDGRLRAELLLCCGLAVNLAYALLQAAIGLAARSVWAGTLAFYYLTLSAIRFSLLLGRKKQSAVLKWRKYRASACIMLLLNAAFLCIHIITAYRGHTIAYPGYMIYAVAAYTFYAAIAAVRNVVIYRKYDDPILSAAKALALAVAAISVYSLQSAMISAFGEPGRFRTVMGVCVGAAVFVLISAISVCMIAKGTWAIHRLDQK